MIALGAPERVQGCAPGALVERATALLADGRLPGLQIAWTGPDGEIATRALGVADAGAGVPLDDRHLFQGASLAKCVTAWAVLRLVDRGQIELDAPVERWTTRWCLPASEFDHCAVTVRRVLAHCAGLSLPDYPGFAPGQELPSLEASLSGANNGGGELRVVEPPGTRFRYSGGGYALLQLLVEEVTGEPFAQCVAREIFAPLQMTRSTFDPSSPLLARAASGHDAQRRPLAFRRYDGAAAAGLLSTAGDLARFAAAHYGEGAAAAAGRGLLGSRSLALALSPHAETRGDDGPWREYGLGFEIDRPAPGRTIAGHHGLNAGWRALLAIEPAARRALVLLANSDAAAPALESLFRGWAGEPLR